jgi:hypothetical protein
MFVIVFAVTSFSQQRETLNNWLKIKVFESTREEVEKIYGKGDEGDNGNNPYVVTYKNSRGITQINYSSGDCKSSKIPLWNVPEWVVTEISYSLSKNPPKLKDIIPDKSQYKRKQAGDVSDHIKYYNDEKGISIIYDKELKEVLNIILEPSLKDKQKYDCDSINNE